MTGEIVPVDDYEALKAAIEPYLADPARTARAAEAALTHVRSTFALENEASALKKVYDRLLAEA